MCSEPSKIVCTPLPILYGTTNDRERIARSEKRECRIGIEPVRKKEGERDYFLGLDGHLWRRLNRLPGLSACQFHCTLLCKIESGVTWHGMLRSLFVRKILAFSCWNFVVK